MENACLPNERAPLREEEFDRSITMIYVKIMKRVVWTLARMTNDRNHLLLPQNPAVWIM